VRDTQAIFDDFAKSTQELTNAAVTAAFRSGVPLGMMAGIGISSIAFLVCLCVAVAHAK